MAIPESASSEFKIPPVSLRTDLRELLFETPLEDGQPLFESVAKLAEVLVHHGNDTGYTKKKSVEALLSQIFRRTRPVPDQLSRAISTVLALQTPTRPAIANSPISSGDIRAAVDRHNSTFPSSNSRFDRARFQEEIKDFRTQAIFVTSALEGRVMPWFDLLVGQAGLLANSALDDVKIDYFVTKIPLAYQLWESLLDAARLNLPTAPESDVAAMLLRANKEGNREPYIRVHVLDKRFVLPGLISQVALAPKTAATVYNFMPPEVTELSNQDAEIWSMNFREFYRRGEFGAQLLFENYYNQRTGKA